MVSPLAIKLAVVVLLGGGDGCSGLIVRGTLPSCSSSLIAFSLSFDLFMAIQVTCPGCLTRFQVNDKFAGKKGPCPKCKAEITIPDASQKVVIHSPEEAGPRDQEGKLVLKPLAREEVKVTRGSVAAILGVIFAAILIALALRFSGGVPLVAKVLGLVIMAPPLVWGGYTFARDQELEPYRGKEVWLRVAIQSAVCAALWLVYAFVPPYLFDLGAAAEAPYWLVGVTFAAMMGLGALGAVAVFELEFFGGLVVAGLYFIVTLSLAVIAGIPLAT